MRNARIPKLFGTSSSVNAMNATDWSDISQVVIYLCHLATHERDVKFKCHNIRHRGVSNVLNV